ncbi:MAG: methyltransferase domain-containing protein [Candidatus Latescibacteria bacterium]|nr:methyltransferase domain-containing protein [Candidatus Latescibacterota bacterium]
MNLLDIVDRTPNPAPWSEGDNIPWDDPEFSERMLAEHLSQEHDLASRRNESIDLQVEWIFSNVLSSRPARVLDLACGPGLYAVRLASLGCECVGIDFSPASIRHARETAAEEGHPACTLYQDDVREADFGHGFDLVMMIYGQFNVFRRDQVLKILEKAHGALKPGGSLLLEVQSREQIQQGGEAPPSWYSTQSGLFSAEPHIVLQENSWDGETGSSTTRFWIIDAQTGAVTRHALSNEAYSEQELTTALQSAGFTDIESYPSLTGEPLAEETDLPVFLVRR